MAYSVPEAQGLDPPAWGQRQAQLLCVRYVHFLSKPTFYTVCLCFIKQTNISVSLCLSIY